MIAMAGAGCKKLQPTDTHPLYQSGMWSDSVTQLHEMNITESEIPEIIKVHEAGMSDQGCIELLRIVRDRKEMFTSGDAMSDLLKVGAAEATVLELARLDQIRPWTGESQGIRLAGYSDAVVLAVARRRSAHLPTVSATSLVELKNIGVTEPRALDLIAHGLTDEQAGQMIGEQQQAEMPKGFVRKGARKTR